MIQRHKLVYLQAYDVSNLIAISDMKLEKHERKGWTLTDIRAQIAPSNENLSIIKLVFEKNCFLNPEPNISLEENSK